jgi:hypothetical protein
MTNVGDAGVGARTNSQGSDTVRLLIGLPARLADLKVGNRGDLHIFSVPDDGFRGRGRKRGIKAMIIRGLEDAV